MQNSKDFKAIDEYQKVSKMFIESSTLFPKQINDNPLHFNFEGNKVKVYYKNTITRSPRIQPIPLILPKQIEVNETLLVGLGLYLGEGTRTNRHVKITNSEPEIIKKAQEFFSHIGLDDSAQFKPWLQIHELSNIEPKIAKKYWEEIIKLNINRIWIKPKIGKKFVRVKQYGVLHLECNRKLARYLIDNLLEKAEELAFAVPNGVKYLLQGLYAAEGYVNRHPAGSLRTIKFTAMRKDDRKFVIKLLSNLDISYFEDIEKGDIRVHGYENLKKLVEIDLFKYHPMRRARMIKGFKNLENSHIPNRNKKRILKILSNRNRYKTTDIQKLASLEYKNTGKHLRELHKLGKVDTLLGKGTLESKWWIK